MECRIALPEPGRKIDATATSALTESQHTRQPRRGRGREPVPSGGEGSCADRGTSVSAPDKASGPIDSSDAPGLVEKHDRGRWRKALRPRAPLMEVPPMSTVRGAPPVWCAC